MLWVWKLELFVEQILTSGKLAWFCQTWCFYKTHKSWLFQIWCFYKTNKSWFCKTWCLYKTNKCGLCQTWCFYKTNKCCSFWDQSELIVLAFNKYIIQEKTELSGIPVFFAKKWMFESNRMSRSFKSFNFFSLFCQNYALDIKNTPGFWFWLFHPIDFQSFTYRI